MEIGEAQLRFEFNAEIDESPGSQKSGGFQFPRKTNPLQKERKQDGKIGFVFSVYGNTSSIYRVEISKNDLTSHVYNYRIKDPINVTRVNAVQIWDRNRLNFTMCLRVNNPRRNRLGKRGKK